MSRPLRADRLEIGSQGQSIYAQDTPPTLASPGTIGSFCVVRADGSWWNRTVAGWLQVTSPRLELVNMDVVPILAGMPVVLGGGGGKAASDLSMSLSAVIGICILGAAPTLSMTIIADGQMTLPTAVWDLVTGGSGGLSPGATYYLASIPGTITTTPPTTTGQSSVELGRALSDSSLLVAIRGPVLL